MGNSDAKDVIDAIQTLSPAQQIDPSKFYVQPVAGDGNIMIIEPQDEKFLGEPRRIRGVTKAYDVDSFQALWAKHSALASELFGDPIQHTFTGVLNADTAAETGVAGFRDHRVEMPLRVTPAWTAWTAVNGTLMSQTDFAEFIEARLSDVVRPAGAELLELASTLEANTSVLFKSGVNLSSGARQLQFEETQTARAGQTGQLEIPKDIELGIAPFEGGDPFRVTARFRYRIRSGTLLLGVVLDRPEDVVKAAFEAFAVALGEACDREVLLGSPPPPTLQVH